MSRHVVGELRNLFRYHKKAILTSNFRQFCMKNDDGKSELGQTTIFVQQGCDIQELPVILKKLNGNDFVSICSNKINLTENDCTTTNSVFKSEEVIIHLDNCMTSTGILSIIDQIPEKDLCPEVAAHAFDRLIRNETLVGLKNLEHSSLVFDKLIDCILKNADHKTLLDFMEVLKTFLDLQKTVQHFCDELLLRNSEGILNIVEVCECVERFVDCRQQIAAEKFWTGIADNEKLIDDKNIKFIYKILPKLKISRRLAIGVLERRIANVWWNLSNEAVTEILTGLVSCHTTAPRTHQSLARWLNTNIHAVDEKSLEVILKCFNKLDFSNSQVERALERYVKAKGIRVKAPSLIVAILEHCAQFRIRSHHILNGCSEYFIANYTRIEPEAIKPILQPYALLNYQPLNAISFWQVFENFLKVNFAKIRPIEIVEVLLNCCYLEMYPLNFVPSIFNPYFLDLMHSTTTSPEKVQKARLDLKLLDTTLSLECKNYAGPLLPRDHSAKSIWQDGRIKRIANNISDYIEKLAGGVDNFSKSVIYAKLPVNSLYIIDILIHPPGMGNLWSYCRQKDRNVYAAVLIHLPEYYNSTGEFLIGPQVMRIRHFRRLGMKVISLDYEKLMKLKMHPKQLEKYLVDCMKQALPAFPE